MKLSYNWLTTYVAHDLSPTALADALTMAGLEVDEVAAHGPSLDGVVVGHVLGARPHPNADRLTCCTVDIGRGEPSAIVCGAPNVAAGQKVAVATVGTTLRLPAREGAGSVEVTLDKRKIRGEVSEGMICAEDELGLGTDHDGILVLAEGAVVGQPFEAYLTQQGRTVRDYVLDISITPNRPDATSHLGVARDVSALTGAPITRPEVALPDAPGGETADRVTVAIDAPEACPRYVAFLVEGVTVGPSPEWLQNRLTNIGLRPRSNVVDVTNFVLHECGQPLHAFDADALAGSAIRVRMSTPGEQVMTLDGQNRTLDTETLLICDADKPVALAGIMGGHNSEVSNTTTTVLIESAYFDPSTIRRAAKALGLQTDASYRFERGVDPTGQVWAAARAADLIARLGGGRVVPGYVDAHPAPHTPTVLDVRLARLTGVLGFEIPGYEATRLLEAIGFAVEAVTPLEQVAELLMMGGAAEDAADTPTLRCTVPPFRPDVTREVDVIEEVVRLYGYDRIPDPTTLPIPTHVPRAEPVPSLRTRVRRALAGQGFREVYTNSLLPAETAETFRPVHAAFGTAGEGIAETLNPVSQEMAALRPSLLPGLLGVTSYNQHHGQRTLRLFEVGHVFRQGARRDAYVPGYAEQENLIVVLAGEAEQASWNAPARPFDFYDAKGVIEHLLGLLALDGIRAEAVHEASATHPYRLDYFAGSVPLGYVAPVAADALGRFDARGPVFAAELNFSALVEKGAASLHRVFDAFTRFPAVERDLAFVLPEAAAVGEVVETLRRTGGRLLQRVDVFDLYQGDRVQQGHKSVAFALRFQSDSTLRDKDVEKIVRRLVQTVEKQHGGHLRT